MWSKKFLRRLLIVEAFIFVGVVIFSLLTRIPFGASLILTGFGFIVFGFMGSSSGARLRSPHGLGSNTMESQMVTDFNDYEQINRTQAMLNDLIIISGVPVVVGIIILVLF